MSSFHTIDTVRFPGRTYCKKQSLHFAKKFKILFLFYRVLEEVGAGQFGTVCKGLWICEGESMLVAVKSLQESASEGERVKFLQEAALMGQFSHPNIIGIHGVVTISTPVREALVHPHNIVHMAFVVPMQTLIVLELATTDLHKYLRGIRAR